MIMEHQKKIYVNQISPKIFKRQNNSYRTKKSPAQSRNLKPYSTKKFTFRWSKDDIYQNNMSQLLAIESEIKQQGKIKQGILIMH